ncbi:unnamed protein product [Durusdinium trenchii]|uniref:Uncharacterized protein n=1 Tax=Durusdinium trenchii TaxID=1381693 RepID=A0ABP0SBI3_9DINO
MMGERGGGAEAELSYGECSIGDFEKWSTLRLQKGMILYCHVMVDQTKVYAPFFIKEAWMNSDTSWTASVACLGVKDSKVSRRLTQLTKVLDEIHLCMEERCQIPGNFLGHVSEVKIIKAEDLPRQDVGQTGWKRWQTLCHEILGLDVSEVAKEGAGMLSREAEREEEVRQGALKHRGRGEGEKAAEAKERAPWREEMLDEEPPEPVEGETQEERQQRVSSYAAREARRIMQRPKGVDLSTALAELKGDLTRAGGAEQRRELMSGRRETSRGREEDLSEVGPHGMGITLQSRQEKVAGLLKPSALERSGETLGHAGDVISAFQLSENRREYNRRVAEIVEERCGHGTPTCQREKLEVSTVNHRRPRRNLVWHATCGTESVSLSRVAHRWAVGKIELREDVTVAPRKFLSLDALCAFRTWLSRPDGRGAAAASRSSGSLPPLMGEHLIEGLNVEVKAFRKEAEEPLLCLNCTSEAQPILQHAVSAAQHAAQGQGGFLKSFDRREAEQSFPELTKSLQGYASVGHICLVQMQLTSKTIWGLGIASNKKAQSRAAHLAAWLHYAASVKNSSWGKGWNQEDTLQKLTQQARLKLREFRAMRGEAVPSSLASPASMASEQQDIRASASRPFAWGVQPKEELRSPRSCSRGSEGASTSARSPFQQDDNKVAFKRCSPSVKEEQDPSALASPCSLPPSPRSRSDSPDWSGGQSRSPSRTGPVKRHRSPPPPQWRQRVTPPWARPIEVPGSDSDGEVQWVTKVKEERRNNVKGPVPTRAPTPRFASSQRGSYKLTCGSVGCHIQVYRGSVEGLVLVEVSATHRVEKCLVYCPTKMWWDNIFATHGIEQIWSWICEEQQGMLLQMVQRGVLLKFVIPGRPCLSDPDLEGLKKLLLTSQQRPCVAMGCSAGGWLALKLLRVMAGWQHLQAVAAVSPAPLDIEEWQKVPHWCCQLASQLARPSQMARLALFWGEGDPSQAPLKSLHKSPHVTRRCLRGKGHIGFLSKELFTQVWQELTASSQSKSEDHSRQAPPVPKFEDEAPAAPPAPPKPPLAAVRRVGIVVDLDRESTQIKGRLRDVDGDGNTEYEFVDFHDLGLDVGDRVQFSMDNLRNCAVDVAREKSGAMNGGYASGAATVPKPSHIEIQRAEQFLRRHAVAADVKEFTHSSMKGFGDEYARNSGKFKFPDDPGSRADLAQTIETAHRLSEHMSGTRLKLFLCEHPTEIYAFVEDIDIVGDSKGGCPSVMRHPGSKQFDYELLKWRAKILHKVFPGSEPLRLVLYEACGWYTGTGSFKESYHLVWPEILVDKETAIAARRFTLEHFEAWSSEQEHRLSELLEKAQKFSPKNTWENIFDATTTRPTVGARMPYSDKRSRMLDNKFKQENRKVLPVAELVFHFEESQELPSVQVVAHAEGKSHAEWAQARHGTPRAKPAREVVLPHQSAPLPAATSKEERHAKRLWRRKRWRWPKRRRKWWLGRWLAKLATMERWQRNPGIASLVSLFAFETPVVCLCDSHPSSKERMAKEDKIEKGEKEVARVEEAAGAVAAGAVTAGAAGPAGTMKTKAPGAAAHHRAAVGSPSMAPLQSLPT